MDFGGRLESRQMIKEKEASEDRENNGLNKNVEVE